MTLNPKNHSCGSHHSPFGFLTGHTRSLSVQVPNTFKLQFQTIKIHNMNWATLIKSAPSSSTAPATESKLRFGSVHVEQESKHASDNSKQSTQPNQSTGNTPSPKTDDVKQKQQWKREQFNLKKQLKLYDDVSFNAKDINSTLKYIGGVDISFFKNSEKAVACLVVLNFPKLEVVYENYMEVTMTVPYIPGFLGFRYVYLIIYYNIWPIERYLTLNY